MATRRQKLRDVLQNAVDNGVTTAQLLDEIQQFTYAGYSGIENFLDQQLEKGSKSKAQEAKVVDLLNEALAILGG